MNNINTAVITFFAALVLSLTAEAQTSQCGPEGTAMVPNGRGAMVRVFCDRPSSSVPVVPPPRPIGTPVQAVTPIAPAVIPAALRPPPVPTFVNRMAPAPRVVPAVAQPLPASTPLPPPAPDPSELQASSSGTRYVEQFDVDGTWTGEVLVNGAEVLRRSAPIRGTEMPRVRVDPAPASMVGGQPGQIRIQVICRIPGRPPQRAPARWVWPNTVYRVSGTQCGW